MAKAQFLVNGTTSMTFYGNNTNWQTTNVTFTATQYATPLRINGLEPGMLLDSISLAAVPNTNTFAVATNGDSLEFNNVSNVIADHISALWSTNANLEVLNSTNVTVQWSDLSDSLNTNTLFHGYGAWLRYGNGTLSLHHNLFADNAYASPASWATTSSWILRTTSFTTGAPTPGSPLMNSLPMIQTASPM